MKTTQYQTAQETADLARLGKLCEDLKERLEAHGFKIMMFRVNLAGDVLTRWADMDQVRGIPLELDTFDDLPPGTIRVAALVQ